MSGSTALLSMPSENLLYKPEKEGRGIGRDADVDAEHGMDAEKYGDGKRKQFICSDIRRKNTRQFHIMTKALVGMCQTKSDISL